MAVSFEIGAVVVEYFTEMSWYQKIAVNPLNRHQNQRSSLELMLYTYLRFSSMERMKGIKANNNIAYYNKQRILRAL